MFMQTRLDSLTNKAQKNGKLPKMEASVPGPSIEMDMKTQFPMSSPKLTLMCMSTIINMHTIIGCPCIIQATLGDGLSVTEGPITQEDLDYVVTRETPDIIFYYDGRNVFILRDRMGIM